MSDEERMAMKTTWAPFMKNMLSGMSKLPTVPQKVLYRGRPETFTAVRELYRGGRGVVWAGITSCSRSCEAAAHIANWEVGCVLELTLSNVYDISSVSFYPKEQEVLRSNWWTTLARPAR